MELEKKVEKSTKIFLHCGEWRACINRPDVTFFSLWHINDDSHTRNDMTVSKKSIEQLRVLVNALLEELESEE